MKLIALLVALLLSQTESSIGADLGKPAPDFKLTDSTGKLRSLADFKGKIVVLEWFNKDCPYVKKHYDSGNMQSIQEKYTKEGVQWLSIQSSAEGKQGFEEKVAAEKTRGLLKVKNTATLLDPTGSVGKLYGAKTTPHMFIINKAGLLAYEGAIDDNDSSDLKVIPQSKNHVAAALTNLMADKAVEISSTRAYGCGVKY